ncbi:MAG: DNA repair protein RecO [Polyangiaceae bacterium]|nr:DNA repair protein RecO [Polyangiaceae bacterium]
MANGAGTRGARKLRERIETRALVTRRIPIAEADLMLTLLTRERGLVSAAARSARRTSSRLGALEPMHTLRVTLEMAPNDDVAKLKEARIERPRLALLDHEARLEAAAELLSFARSLVVEGPNEAESFDIVESGLDAIAERDPSEASAVLAWGGAQLLAATGYALDLEACVRCGTPCPPGAAALVDPAAGGLVCRACGGGPILLSGARRAAISEWFRSGEGTLDVDDAALAARLVKEAISSRGRSRQGQSSLVPGSRRGPP